MRSNDELNVSVSDKAGYRAENASPAADTQTFHKTTPTPAERSQLLQDLGPSLPPSARDSSPRLPQIPLQPNRRSVEPVRGDDDGISFPALLAAGSIIAVSILIAGAVFLLMVMKPPAEAPPPEPEVQEVDGIPVHKGFKDPGVQ